MKKKSALTIIISFLILLILLLSYLILRTTPNSQQANKSINFNYLDGTTPVGLGYISTSDDQSIAFVIADIKDVSKNGNIVYFDVVTSLNSPITYKILAYSGVASFVVRFQNVPYLYPASANYTMHIYKNSDVYNQLSAMNGSKVILFVNLPSGKQFSQNTLNCNKSLLDAIQRSSTISCTPFIAGVGIYALSK